MERGAVRDMVEQDILIHVPLSVTTIWHLFTDNNTSVGAVEFSNICQGTQEDSHPLLCIVIGIKPLVLAMDHGVARELASAPPSYGPGAPVESCLRQSPMDKRVFVEVQVSNGKVPAQCWNKNA